MNATFLFIFTSIEKKIGYVVLYIINVYREAKKIVKVFIIKLLGNEKAGFIMRINRINDWNGVL